MNFFAFVISVLMGVGSLAYVYSGTGFDQLVRGLLILGALWLYAGRKRWTWFSTIALLFSVALAGYGLWVGLSPGWMVAGAIGALLAWDLTEFMRRMDGAFETDDLPGMQRRHLARLTVVALIGLLLASISMLVRLEFTLEWMMLLAMVGVLGITQLVAWLRREK
jgi:hypothetical protein